MWLGYKWKWKWSEVTQLCLTLHDPMDCSLPGSSVNGIFQARVLEWGAIAFSWLGYKGVIKQGRKFSKRVLETNGKQKTCLGTQERDTVLWHGWEHLCFWVICKIISILSIGNVRHEQRHSLPYKVIQTSNLKSWFLPTLMRKMDSLWLL